MPSHIPTEFSNLTTIFIPPNCTAKLQLLDCSIFATVKNQYYSWLMKETVACGPENINLEIAVISMANIFNSMDVKSINYGFKKKLVSTCINQNQLQRLHWPEKNKFSIFANVLTSSHVETNVLVFYTQIKYHQIFQNFENSHEMCQSLECQSLGDDGMT